MNVCALEFGGCHFNIAVGLCGLCPQSAEAFDVVVYRPRPYIAAARLCSPHIAFSCEQGPKT